MVNPNLTHIYPVIDRSGSIAKHRAAYEEGFNAFIAEQAQLPDPCFVTLAQFNEEYEVVYAHRPIQEVPPLTIKPSGGTALLDAVARTIEVAGEQLSALPEHERPGSVIVPIVTDGEENSSRRFDWETVKGLIERQTRDYQWLFVYVGANQDAFAVGAQLGVGRAQTLTYDTHHTTSAFTAVSGVTTNYRGATSRGASYDEATAAAAFTEAQRQDALIGAETTSEGKRS